MNLKACLQDIEILHGFGIKSYQSNQFNENNYMQTQFLSWFSSINPNQWVPLVAFIYLILLFYLN